MVVRQLGGSKIIKSNVLLENLFLSSTYKAILARIAQRALQGATVNLSKAVSSIDTAQFSQSKPKVTVATADGRTQVFDAVVLTVPLGSLKRSQPALQPALTDRLLTAVKNISYGRLEKAFVTFDTAFWDCPDALPDSPQASSSNPVFRHFLHPLYAPMNPHSHDIGMMSLFSLPGGIVHPTLLFYIHGDYATEMTDLLAPHQPGSESYRSTLIKFLSPYYSRLPNYDGDSSKCKPRGACATSWQRDSFAGYGSYTNFQIPNPAAEEGSDDYPHLDGDIEALRRGLPERGLWLAGEHTAPFIALGTVTGAYLSGEAVAKEIVAWFGGQGVGIDSAVDMATGDRMVQIGKGGKEGVSGVEV